MNDHAVTFEAVDAAMEQAYDEFVNLDEGAVAQVYPVLAQADANLFGLCAVDVDAHVWERGDAEAGFGLMSVAKPFTFALVCARLGASRARAELGANATGSEYNDVAPVLAAPGGRTNPMVNAGAIATCSRIPGEDAEQQWAYLLDGLSAFAGRQLYLDDELYENVIATNTRNRELAAALASKRALATDAASALELYSKQSCLSVTAHDLAVMGATLAYGGVNPITGVRVVPASAVRPVLAVMTVSGLYEISGDWFYEVALPAKTGLGGGIVTVVPGRMALGGFSPLLDAAANTVRGARAHALVAARLGLGLL